MSQPIIHESFFKDPDGVRKFALNEQFWDCSFTSIMRGSWPGKRSHMVHWLSAEIFDEFVENISGILGLTADQEMYVEAYFQYCTVHDGDSWVHRDMDDLDKTHVGVIYLSPDPPPNSGTIIYEMPPSLEQQFDHNDPSSKYPADPSEYNVKQILENQYNRLVLYSPQDFHKSDTYFGEGKQDGRLFMVFFMRVEERKQ